MAPDILQDLIDQFASSLQHLPDEELPAQEHGLREALADYHLAPHKLLMDQGDEVLALAMRRNFFFREAYNEFNERFEEQVQSWLRRWGVEYHLAFDLTQTLMLQCFLRRLATYRSERGRLKAYLRRAAYNLWMEHCRRFRAFSPLPEDVPQQAADTGESVALANMEEALQRAIEHLPSELRPVLELHLQGLSHAEIATRLGITTCASQQRLFKARTALKKQLGLDFRGTTRGRPRHDPPDETERNPEQDHDETERNPEQDHDETER
jgi:RNA polymerase sigma factor (sigma-70 family)